MRRFGILVAAVVLAGCSADGAATTPSTKVIASTSTTGTIAKPITTTGATLARTSTTSTTFVSPPELVIDAVLSSPSAPWHSVAVETPQISVSGYVDAGSSVRLIVTSPPVDGDIVFDSPAEVEGDYFAGTVTLALGRNMVAIVATSPAGAKSSLALDARYEPDANVEFGYLDRVAATEIVVDYAQWLTGEEAAQAAYEDGSIATVEEGVPNDYYIRNVNPQLRTLPLASDASLWLISPAGQIGSVRVDLGEWLVLFNDGVPWDWEADNVPSWEEHPHYGYFGASMIDTPYWFVILDGEVIAVEQQYVP
ncbi:MAG: hypothetical protein ACN4GK_00280 [Acidimicrobiia bacterium]